MKNINVKIRNIIFLLFFSLSSCFAPRNPPVFILKRNSGDFITNAKITWMSLIIEKKELGNNNFSKILDIWCSDTSGVDSFKINLFDISNLKSKDYLHINYYSDSLSKILIGRNEKIKISLNVSQYKLYGSKNDDMRTYMIDTLVNLDTIPLKEKVILKCERWY